MSELLLTVDTSTQAGSVALSRGDALLGEILLNVPGTHTDRLLLSVRQLLSDAALRLEQVDAFGVVVGPGSFTGLRVGVATVKGLALATGRPVAGVSSLQTVASQWAYARYPVCAMLDARKKEVYCGLYACSGDGATPLGPEAVLPPEALLETLEGDILFAGDGAVAYRTLIVRRFGARAHFAPWPQAPPRASAAAGLALAAVRRGDTVPLPSLVPRYIRPSEAELLWTQRLAEGAIDG